MRKDRKPKITTVGERATHKVRWKYTLEHWVAFVLVENDDGYAWVQHGPLHRQIGKDGRGRFVWPDQSIHDFPKWNIVLYALPTDHRPSAEILVERLLEKFNNYNREDYWKPAAGLRRGLPEIKGMVDTSESDHDMYENVVNSLRIVQ